MAYKTILVNDFASTITMHTLGAWQTQYIFMGVILQYPHSFYGYGTHLIGIIKCDLSTIICDVGTIQCDIGTI